ncbi:MAG: hypothetical protein Q7R52_02540 [archaeon]|nr:hypothetical protein [archaeon]
MVFYDHWWFWLFSIPLSSFVLVIILGLIAIVGEVIIKIFQSFFEIFKRKKGD